MSENPVAVVTGAARGQGRSVSVALAREGVDIIAIDRCADIESIPYPPATKEDLDDPRNEQVYRDIVETNLFGAWNTIAATVPSIIRKGRGGSIVLTSSVQGLTGRGGDGSAAVFAYAASKHGIVGLMHSAANAYASDNIRVNTVHPTGVATPMILNENMAKMHAEGRLDTAMSGNLLDVPWVEPEDVANAVAWLVSDKARYITGVALPVDAGCVAM